MLLAERDRLEVEVRARTTELTELARHLETTREDERARLARDLHDELGALLTAAKLDVARIRPKLQQIAPDLLPRVTHLIETLNSGIALKRRIIEDLRPSTLDSLGLQAALEVLCNEFAERMNLPVLTRLEPTRLTRSADLTVFRLVQESLSNIAKHARATRIEVSLAQDDGRACITVKDNGVGFSPGTTGPSRHGLIGMRYRVEAEQGQLSVQSAPGQGTTLFACLPQQLADHEPSVTAADDTESAPSVP
jgi:signal transduction histidine kinase